MNRTELLKLIDAVDSRLIELCEELDYYIRELDNDDELEELQQLSEKLELAQFHTSFFCEAHATEIEDANAKKEERHVTIVQSNGLLKSVLVND